MLIFPAYGLFGSHGEERRINRGIDDRFREANDGASVWIACRTMNLLLKLDSVDSLIRIERHSDGAVSFLVYHCLWQRCLRIKHHPPLNSAFRLQHDGIVTFDVNRTATAFREERKEHRV